MGKGGGGGTRDIMMFRFSATYGTLNNLQMDYHAINRPYIINQ